MAPDIKSLFLRSTSQLTLDAHSSRLGEILPSPDSFCVALVHLGWGQNPLDTPKVSVTSRLAQLSEGVTPS